MEAEVTIEKLRQIVLYVLLLVLVATILSVIILSLGSKTSPLYAVV